MIRRLAAAEIRRRLAAYPAVALLGPRQAGKTTLAQSLGGHYYDLEQEGERVRLDLEWHDRMVGRQRLIFDEAQAWPELFPRLRGAIDQQRKRNGRFLLLGSVAPALTRQISESLAGRLSQVELTPFLWGEVGRARQKSLWYHGGYPDGGILDARRFPRWQLDYLGLLVQRDLPGWGLQATPQMTGRFLRLVAAVHGQIWNASQIGQSLGVSYHTVNGYLDYLEGAFLIRRLLPYHPNIGKRLVKRPKVYWRDTGLLHALLQVPDEDSLLVQPWVGASWEGYVIEQVLGELAARGEHFTPYYFRTSDGREIDLVIEIGGERWAIEIKLTASPYAEDLAKLDRAAEMIGASRRYLVSQTPRSAGDVRRASCNLAGLFERIRK